MSLFTSLFSGPINREVNRQTASLARSMANQYITGMSNLLFDGQIIINAQDYDYVEDGYNAVGAVYECISLIINKIVACPRIVYRVKDEKELKKYYALSQSAGSQVKAALAKAKALEEVSHKQIEKLLYNPNSKENGDDMLQMLAGMLLLNGNAYAYGNAGLQSDRNAKKWSELWAMPAPLSIRSGGFMQPVKEYVLAAQYYTQETPFPADQIKHFRTANFSYSQQNSQLYGTSPLRAYLYSLDTYRNADKQSDKQMKSGGKLGLLTPKNKEDNFTEGQRDDMHSALKEAYGSKEDLARILPFSVALDFLELGLSSQELELLKTKADKKDDIYNAYHVPLQFAHQDTATYNNLPMANRQLVYNAVCPWARKLELGLTEFIATPYNTKTDKYVIILDYTALPELNDDMKTVAEWLQLCDDLTPNEKREVKGWGRSSEVGMDQIYISRNKVPLADVLAGKVSYNAATDSSVNPAT